MSSCSWHFPKFFLEDYFRPLKGCSKREKGVRIKSFHCINNRLLWSDPHLSILHFGFLANRWKKRNLSRCRKLLGLSPQIPKPDKKTSRELMLEFTGIDLTRCPCCKKGIMGIIAEIQQYSQDSLDHLSYLPLIRDST